LCHGSKNREVPKAEGAKIQDFTVCSASIMENGTHSTGLKPTTTITTTVTTTSS